MANMPRYSNRDVSVRLSVANLAASTPLPAIKSSNQVKNLLASAAALHMGIAQGILAEGCLTNGNYDRDLMWLGENQETPFQMRVIGNDIYRNAPDALGTTKAGRLKNLSGHTPKPSDKTTYAAPEPRKASVPKEPLALCLTVFLSEHCFRTPNNYARPHDKDVDIVVFFNGELSNSEYVPYRFGSETYKYTQHVVRFSGCRIGKQLEKPWVVLPPKANGETPPLEDMQILDDKIASTWNAVNAALIKTAENNCKDLSDNKRYTHLGNYLKSLANVPMPPNLMTTEDGKRCDRTRPFSIIDIVILAGKGRKDLSGEGDVIDKPTLLRSSRIKATEPAHEAARDPGGAVSSLKPSPTTPVAPPVGAAMQDDTTGHTEVGGPSSEGSIESPYVSSQGHYSHSPHATTQGHNDGYSYASAAGVAVGQSSAGAQRQSLESPYAAAQGHSVESAFSISQDHTIESLPATPQNQITLSTETTQPNDTPSEQAAISTSGNTPSSADNTTTSLPHPAKKRRFVPEAEKAAASHREKVRRRFTVPEDFIPESVPGFGTRQQRTRSGHLNLPAPAPPAAAAAAAPIPAAPKRKRAPRPPGFTRAINTDQPVEEQIKDLEMQISEAALQDLNDPAPHTDAESSSSSDTAPRNPGFSTPFFSSSNALPTKRRRAVKKSSSSVFMSASEIARQEAGFVPVLADPDLGVTYAKKGVVRQAKMERGGWFEEEEVMFGVRMLC